MRYKRPAASNIGIDRDRAVITAWRDRTSSLSATSAELAESDDAGSARQKQRGSTPDPGPTVKSADGRSRWRFVTGDGIRFLERYQFDGSELVYADPPYPHATRGRCDLYRYEMSDLQHRRLLRCIRSLPCLVMVSSYWTETYARELAGWNYTQFEAMTRAGHTATESLWFNFPTPVELHDYRYLGTNFRERERIKRKKLRWVNRLGRMDGLERQALLSAISDSGISGDATRLFWAGTF